MEQNQKQQVVERLKSANNVLITVSANPNVDQLASLIGFTLLMNKIGKHATAVFSGAVPSTLEFLQPEKTIETNTDSLRDFIIALDKSKADKLRYKVEDEVVRIFITPYRTSLSEKDLDFSQGDFNVDAVLAIGVVNKEAIDQAIVAHGRILHDATVMTVTNGQAPSDVGSINWHDPVASSLSEMLVSISESFGSNLLDPQMATSFLTGIVSETDRFSNDKTSPKVMTMSAQLMAAGANQQLIATKLQPPEPEAPAPQPFAAPQTPSDESSATPAESTPAPAPAPAAPNNDGEISIDHEDEIHIDEQGNLKRQDELADAEAAAKKKADQEQAAQTQEESKPQESPVLGMPDTQGNEDPGYLAGDAHKVVQPLPDQKIDPLADAAPQQNSSLPPIDLPPVAPQSDMSAVATELPQVASVDTTPQSTDTSFAIPPQPTDAAPVPSVDEARSAVMTASLDSVPRPQAAQAVGAQFVDINPEPTPDTGMPNVVAPQTDQTAMPAVGDVLQQTQPGLITPTGPPDHIPDPMAPPPVPPPMMPMQPGAPQITTHHAYLNPADNDTAPDTPTQL